MAFLSLDTSWSGEYAPWMISRAIIGMDTIRKGCVTMKTGIKKIYTIDRMDLRDPLKVREETPTANPNTGFTIDSRILVPGDIEMYEVVNPRDLEATQHAPELADAILAEQVPNNMATQLIQLALNRSGESLEKGIWMGSTAFKGHYVQGDPNYQLQFFNGFMQRLVNDPLVVLSTISPAPITGSNIFLILDDLINQLVSNTDTQALITDEDSYKDMKFLLNGSTWLTYTQALRNASFKGLALDERGTPMWGGYRVELLAGMPPNTILFCRATEDAKKSNLWVGVNSEKDWDVIFDKVNSNKFSESYAMLAKWKWDVNYGWPQEIAMFTTCTKAQFLAPGEGE